MGADGRPDLFVAIEAPLEDLADLAKAVVAMTLHRDTHHCLLAIARA
jgi:hypothetical protein